jgi:phospholipase/carboxylesterase
MTIQIDGPRLAPVAGSAAQQLVIFLHGYGADGNDLIGLGREWGQMLPNAAFVSPHAPEELPAAFGFGGRQWFAIERRNEQEWEEGVRRAQPVLEAFILAEAERAKLPLCSVALVGFSQGTMMALQTGLRLSEPLAAIVGYSGHLAGAARLQDEIKSKPPVILFHGTDDEIIPVQAIHHAREALAAAGVPVEWHVRPHLGHGIDGEGLMLGGQFLRTAFDAPVK